MTNVQHDTQSNNQPSLDILKWIGVLAKLRTVHWNIICAILLFAAVSLILYQSSYEVMLTFKSPLQIILYYKTSMLLILGSASVVIFNAGIAVTRMLQENPYLLANGIAGAVALYGALISIYSLLTVAPTSIGSDLTFNRGGLFITTGMSYFFGAAVQLRKAERVVGKPQPPTSTNTNSRSKK